MNGVVLLAGGLLLVAVIKLIIDRNWIGLLLCAVDRCLMYGLSISNKFRLCFIIRFG